MNFRFLKPRTTILGALKISKEDTVSLSMGHRDINLFKPKEVVSEIKDLIIREKKFILSKTGKAPEQILMSSYVYEVVVCMESKYENERFYPVYPTEICEMKIIVDGSIEGIYVRALMNTIDEWIWGKSTRGLNEDEYTTR